MHLAQLRFDGSSSALLGPCGGAPLQARKLNFASMQNCPAAIGANSAWERNRSRIARLPCTISGLIRHGVFLGFRRARRGRTVRHEPHGQSYRRGCRHRSWRGDPNHRRRDLAVVRGRSRSDRARFHVSCPRQNFCRSPAKVTASALDRATQGLIVRRRARMRAGVFLCVPMRAAEGLKAPACYSLECPS